MQISRAVLVASFALTAFPVAAAGNGFLDQTDQCRSGNTSYADTSETIAGLSYYSSLIADDFAVPAGATWTVDSLSVLGIYFASSGTPNPATSFNVFFYDNSNGAPSHLLTSCTQSGVGYNTSSPDPYSTFFNIPLGAPCVLSGGANGSVYWVSIQANMPAGSNADWGWQERFVQSGNAAHVEYPGGSSGASCQVWSLKTACVGSFDVRPDQCFFLAGNNGNIIFKNGFE